MADTCDTVFLLGAGASKGAGLPDTWEFVGRFEEALQKRDERAALQRILGPLRKAHPDGVDVELLLEAITRLQEFELDPLRAFGAAVRPNGRRLVEDASRLAPLLRDFIKRTTYVEREKTKYLDPLIDFVRHYGVIDVGTLNYDTAIEELGGRHAIDVHDGFEEEWRAGRLTDTESGIRLYKLHGSVTWYETREGRYVKSMTRSDSSIVDLVRRGTAESLMFYPLRKWAYSEPMVGTLQEYKRRLESSSTRFLVVIGYSFRDRHVHGVIRDAMRNNPALELVLLNPSAHQVLERELLRDVHGARAEELRRRILCLPFQAERALRRLKHVDLETLRRAVTSESQAVSLVASHGTASFVDAVIDFARCGHVDRVRQQLPSFFDSELTPGRRWEVHLRVAIAEVARASKVERSELLHGVADVVAEEFIERIEAEVSGAPFGVAFRLVEGRGSSQSWPAFGSTAETLLTEVSKWSEASGGVEELGRLVDGVQRALDLLSTDSSAEMTLSEMVRRLSLPDDEVARARHLEQSAQKAVDGGHMPVNELAKLSQLVTDGLRNAMVRTVHEALHA